MTNLNLIKVIVKLLANTDNFNLKKNFFFNSQSKIKRYTLYHQCNINSISNLEFAIKMEKQTNDKFLDFTTS